MLHCSRDGLRDNILNYADVSTESYSSISWFWRYIYIFSVPWICIVLRLSHTKSLLVPGEPKNLGIRNSFIFQITNLRFIIFLLGFAWRLVLLYYTQINKINCHYWRFIWKSPCLCPQICIYIYMSILIICGYVQQSPHKHRISEYWIIAPKGSTGSCSCEAFSSVNQYITLFYVGFSLSTL